MTAHTTTNVTSASKSGSNTAANKLKPFYIELFRYFS
jgi:hypothetical protein